MSFESYKATVFGGQKLHLSLLALAVSSSSCTTQTACLAYCKEHNICLWVSLRQRVTTTAAWSCDLLWTKPSQICPTFPFSLFGPSCLKVYNIDECV